MRAFLAAVLTAVVLLSAAAPHRHADQHGHERCATCVVRSADVARDATPDVSPRVVVLAAPSSAPALPPVTGAPLGAIPGQSPPRA